MILFETLAQPTIIFYVALSGFLSGLCFDVAYIITFLCNQNKIVKNIFEFFATVCSFFVLFVVNQILLYGQFRLYVLLFFVAFLILEQYTLGKLIAKTRNWCYITFRKISQRILKLCKRKRNSKQH